LGWLWFRDPNREKNPPPSYYPYHRVAANMPCPFCSANSDAASSTGSSSGGNSNGGSSGPSGSNNNNTIRSTCRNTVCPQILAATQHNNALMVFARGNDNNIWYNTAPATSLSPNWPSASSWQNLQGGPFLSQPAAQVWRPDNQSSLRVSVSAVGDPDRGARLRQLDTATSQWNNWKNLRGSVSSPISLCSVGEFRLDLWAASGGDINHNFHSGGAEDKYWAPDASPTWQGTTKFGEQRITARPGIACRWNLFGHDVVVIGEKGEMIHTRYSGPNGWVPPFVLDGGGKLTADPVVLATTNERLDFFAVGVDKAIYHASWSEEAGYSLLNSLGGSFQSVPSAVVTRSGRIDVVALATTDTLHHRVYQGGQWSEAWEDLGVVGNSAPLVANLTTSPESVAVFVLGTNGQLNQTSWKVSNDLSWKGLTWKGMGGDLTATYFKL